MIARVPAVPRSRFGGLTHPRGVLLVTGALFVALALFAALVGVFPADAGIRDALLGIASPGVIAVMRLVNAAGDWRLLAPGVVLLLLGVPRARDRWWLWVGAILLATFVPDVFKVVVGRPRPEGVALGFPSGHATAAAAFFGVVCYLAGALPRLACWPVRVGALVVIVLVGIARVVLRAHWPSDVAGGIALGLALAALAALVDAMSRGDAGSPRRPERGGPGGVGEAVSVPPQ